MIDIDGKEIQFHCIESEDSSVTFTFDASGMNTKEMFMKWVQFMNAIGYVLDPAEMESLWNGTKQCIHCGKNPSE